MREMRKKIISLSQRDIDNRAREIINNCIINMEVRDVDNWTYYVCLPNDYELYFLIKNSIDFLTKDNKDYIFMVSNVTVDKQFTLVVDAKVRVNKLINSK